MVGFSENPRDNSGVAMKKFLEIVIILWIHLKLLEKNFYLFLFLHLN